MISEFPLWVFTLLTGIAAGCYVGAAALPAQGPTTAKKANVALPIVALVLVAIGGIAAMTHLGRPELMLNVLNNPTSSLTLEGASAGVLAVVAIIDLIICLTKHEANRVVRIIGAVVGIVCMLIVTGAYTGSYGNLAWIAAPTYPLFIVGDLAAGIGLWNALSDDEGKTGNIIAAVASVLLAAVLFWQSTVFGALAEAGTTMLVAGAVLALVAAAIAAVCAAGKGNVKTLTWVYAIIAIVAVMVSRYGFYMASII